MYLLTVSLPHRISETSTQQPSGFVQSMISEVVLGPQAESTTRSFLSLRSDPYKQSLFSGWKTDGWVRWLEGLRGEYERRMNRMCTILDEGMFRVVEVRGCGGIGPVRSSFHDSPMPKWKNGSDGTAFSSHKSDDAETEVERWTVVTKTQLYEYDWPRGGMFIWIRMLFETHPLFERPFPAPVGDKKLDQSHAPLKVTGAMLCIGLTMFLTHAPYLTLVAPGIMFSATDKIRDERAWQYYRLCFAAESDENVERCSKGFAQGVQDFWAIEDLDELKALLDEAGGLAPPFAGGSDDDRDDVEGLRNCVEALGAGWMGC